MDGDGVFFLVLYLLCTIILIGTYTWTFQRVSIPYPWGFNWHPLEGAGISIEIYAVIHIFDEGLDL